MRVTATEAKNRFGAICARAKAEPVFVEKDGRVDTVVLSVEAFEQLRAQSQQKSIEDRRSEFEKKHAKWFSQQVKDVETHGVWSDGLRVW